MCPLVLVILITSLIFCCLCNIFSPVYYHSFYESLASHLFSICFLILLNSDIRGQSIKKPNFIFFNLLLYLQLNQTCLFKVLPSTLDTLLPTPNVVSSSGTGPGTCFGGWREGPISNLFSLLYRLKLTTF